MAGPGIARGLIVLSWATRIRDRKKRTEARAAPKNSMAYVYSDKGIVLPGLTGAANGRRIPPEQGQMLQGFLGPPGQGELDPSYVRWVQSSLSRILGVHLTVDGRMGPETRSAIRNFQQRYGLRPDGFVGTQTEQALRSAGTGLAPRAVAPPSASSLIKREDQPPSYTLYLNITLGGESPARPMTGIFVPSGYQPQREVDFILYLHGYKLSFSEASIDRYWDRRSFPYWPLREGVNDSGKNVILVAPTLGPRSQPGSLTRPGGFDGYLGQVMTALRDFGPYRGRTPPAVGSIILACHSGGGWPMRQLAMPDRPGQYTARIRECWGFDCLYNTGDETAWAQWARSRPDAKLYVYYLGTTEARSQRLQQQRVPNVVVERSSAPGHNWVPITHWKNRIQDARFLPGR